MDIPSLVLSHRAVVEADRRVITNLAADLPLAPKLVRDHYLARQAVMVASTRAVLGIHTPDLVQGLVRILEIVDAVTAVTLEALVQDAVDM